MTIESYEKSVIEWANARGLLAGTTPEKQTFKLGSEFGELCDAIAMEDREEIIDGIGDMLVVMINLCAKMGLSLEMCLAAAWMQIKDRKGEMINGTFVKDGDAQ